MVPLVNFFALLVGIAALLHGGAANAAAPAPIWSGESGGFAVRWTTAEIEARRNGRIVFSARNWVRAGLAHFIAVNRTPENPNPPDCEYRRNLRILSLVGPLMSLEDETEITCRREAHPGGMTRLLTIDLASSGQLTEAGEDAIGQVDTRRPGRFVLLTTIFPEMQVFRALAAAKPIANVLNRAGAKPHTLAGLIEAVSDTSGDDDACYVIPPDLLAHFTFVRLQNQSVIVRLGLPGDGPCRTALTTADLSFPVPASLSDWLRAASDARVGFLADDAKLIARRRSAEFVLRSGRGPAPER